jgi:hypothetical protein
MPNPHFTPFNPGAILADGKPPLMQENALFCRPQAICFMILKDHKITLIFGLKQRKPDDNSKLVCIGGMRVADLDRRIGQGQFSQDGSRCRALRQRQSA